MAPDPDTPDEAARRSGVSRRQLLGYAGAAAIGATVAGTVAVVASGSDGSDSSDGGAPGTTTSSAEGSSTTGPSSIPTVPRRALVDGYLVTDFGATPDDAAGGVNGAIAAAARDGGGVVRVPDGQWTLHEPVQVPANVTLAGQSMLGTVLRAAGAATVVAHAANVEGATVENLTVDGGGAARTGIAYTGGARYCALRRVRVSGVRGPGVQLQGGRVDRMYLEDLFVSEVDGHGVDVDVDDATSLFVTGLAVVGFGRGSAPPAYGIALRARAHLCQVDIEGVQAGHVGVGFLPGSDYSTLTGFYIGLDGGVGHTGSVAHKIAIGNGSVR
jgi:hypothetical protein